MTNEHPSKVAAYHTALTWRQQLARGVELWAICRAMFVSVVVSSLANSFGFMAEAAAPAAAVLHVNDTVPVLPAQSCASAGKFSLVVMSMIMTNPVG